MSGAGGRRRTYDLRITNRYKTLRRQRVRRLYLIVTPRSAASTSSPRQRKAGAQRLRRAVQPEGGARGGHMGAGFGRRCSPDPCRTPPRARCSKGRGNHHHPEFAALTLAQDAGGPSVTRSRPSAAGHLRPARTRATLGAGSDNRDGNQRMAGTSPPAPAPGVPLRYVRAPGPPA
jgi:hypothetical protein